MLANYVKIALRNLRKQLGYTFINVVGLALGIACCLLIVLLVSHEWSFDRFHENGDRIFRVYIQEESPDGALEPHLLSPPSLAPALDSAFASVEAVSRVIANHGHFRRDDRSFVERFQLADPGFLRMFSFPLLAGDPVGALRDIQSMVVTEETARKFFGVPPGEYHRVLGERVTFVQGEDAFEFQITGVMKSIPETSSFDFDVLISFENYFLEENGRIVAGGNHWGSKNTLYVMLRPGERPESLEARLGPFTRTQLADRIDSRRAADYLADGEDALRLRLQPLADVHLNPKIGNYYEATTHDPTYSYVLGGIGLLVLVIACINFMTLSVGRSATRAREVGMRKVMGASRAQLMKQFWGEALLLTLVALLAALGLVALVLPEFNLLTGKALRFASLGSANAFLGLVSVLVTVALFAGAYPAVVLSRFQPADVLKGDVPSRRSRLTRGLIVAQYAVSVALIFSTIVMYRQLDFMLNTDIGFKDDQLLVLHTGGLNTRQENLILEAVRAATSSNPDVTHVLRTGYAFTHSYDQRSWTAPDGRTIQAHMLGVDFDFLEAMEMTLVDGRDFSRERPSDSTRSVLVNDAFVRKYGIEQPIGYELSGFGGFFGEVDPVIIGVVEDFNFRSLHEEIEPAMMNVHPDYYHGMSHMLIKLRPADVRTTIEEVHQIWSSIFPEKPFRYSFLDEDIEAQYQQERRWSRILTYSSLLAILIACMGLFGLATLSVSRRRKEIGVRKVLGATIAHVAMLVTREFILLVAAAAVIAWPLAYVGMQRWLADFAYRAGIPWWVFFASAAAALTIALVTVSYQAYRAAVTDPAKSLRYE